MTTPHTQPSGGPGTPTSAPPTLAEDILLLLFQPGRRPHSSAGTIAGEGTLYSVLAGAALTDLALGEFVTTGTGRFGGVTVHAVDRAAPADPLLRPAWDYVSRPRGVQGVLAAVGPQLREPVIDRVVARGDLQRIERMRLGIFTTATLVEGRTGRRAQLVAEVRSVLLDGREPTARTAALAALLYGSGTMPAHDREIPWNSTTIRRAQQFTNGNWGASATAKAVTRTVIATVVGLAIASTTASSSQ